MTAAQGQTSSLLTDDDRPLSAAELGRLLREHVDATMTSVCRRWFVGAMVMQAATIVAIIAAVRL